MYRPFIAERTDEKFNGAIQASTRPAESREKNTILPAVAPVAQIEPTFTELKSILTVIDGNDDRSGIGSVQASVMPTESCEKTCILVSGV